MITQDILLRILMIMTMTEFGKSASKNKEDGFKEQREQLKDIPTSSPLTYNPDDAIKMLNDGLKSASNKIGLMTKQGIPGMLLSTINSLKITGMSNKDSGLLHSNNIFSGFFRLLGFDTDKLQAIALNAIVFIAQTIGNNLTRRQFKKNGKDKEDDKILDIEDNLKGDLKTGSPLEWVLQNAPDEVKKLVIDAQQRNLTDDLIEIMQDRSISVQKEAYCLQHLICRLTPVIKGIQENTKSLININQNTQDNQSKMNISQENWLEMSPSERMYAYMPKNEDFVKQKAICEEIIPPCIINGIK